MTRQLRTVRTIAAAFFRVLYPALVYILGYSQGGTQVLVGVGTLFLVKCFVLFPAFILVNFNTLIQVVRNVLLYTCGRTMEVFTCTRASVCIRAGLKTKYKEKYYLFYF